MPASFPMIAALLGDLDNRDGQGTVFYRQDRSPAVLSRAAEHITQAFPRDEGVEPLNVLVVTWVDMAARGTSGRGDRVDTKRNTFQLVVASMKSSSFAILLYPTDGLQFLSTSVGGLVPGLHEDEGTTGPPVTVLPDRPDEQQEVEVSTDTTQMMVSSEAATEEKEELPTESTTGYQTGSTEAEGITPGFVKPEHEEQFPESETVTYNSPERVHPRYPDNPEPVQPRYISPEPVLPVPPHSQPQHPQVVVVDEDEDLDVNVFSYNLETCEHNRHKCSKFADCRDYSDGFCCHCRPGFYGSGKDCVAEGKPQRMNGKVKGRVLVGDSPVELRNNDLHSYVVANDGRAYVAISSVPPSLGPSLQPLSSLGGVIGWAFALEQPGFHNGFSLIGGVFSRQAEVIFQPGNERLSIKQQFEGIDAHEHLVVSTELEGRLPPIPLGASVQISPYQEIYQYDTNLITSSSNRDYTITSPDGTVQTRSYQWRQTISFQSCPHHQVTGAAPSTQQLSVDQIFVMFDADNNLTRYAMSNKIGSVQGSPPEQNPCFTGRHGCDINAVCRPQPGLRSTCQCTAGFTGDGRYCHDVDECRETSWICGSNSVCSNQPGTFRCECLTGFTSTSDGRTCVEEHRAVDHCRTGSHDCDVPDRASCSYTGGSSYVCSCLPGFEGDGRSCHDVDECRLERCHGDALCSNTPGSFTCQCRPGFHGDGHQCRPMSSGINHAVTPPPLGPTPRPDVQPVSPGTHLLFAQSGRIELLPLDGYSMRTEDAKPLLHVPDRVVIAIAYDCVDKMVYWTDITGPAISRASLSGGDVTPVVTEELQSPEGVAIDHVSRLLFWTDSMRDTVEVSQLDGSQRRVLFDSDLVNPRAIVTNPPYGRLYWADWDRDGPKIETSNMDGTERSVLVKDDLGLPNGLTFDLDTQQLCWADAGTHKVECMDPHRRIRRQIVDRIQFPFALVSLGRKLYYTDWRREAVVSVDRLSETETDEFLPQRRSRLYGITTATTQCPQVYNYCINNGGCSHLCLPRLGGFSCRCPDAGRCEDRTS
ncbi:nidogen-1 [Pleuronectes platessa]|uniref:nidogen-1 n=1 Tax=Pleuronectes platessa TaxID=8262 RepID=UPI00232A2885|nr:nidogen-1 [Pleuronectes platessa]